VVVLAELSYSFASVALCNLNSGTRKSSRTTVNGATADQAGPGQIICTPRRLKALKALTSHNGASRSFESVVRISTMLLLFPSWIVSIALLPSLVSCRLLGKEQLKAIHKTEFDYVILGGGTAGLVIASRLSEDPGVSVAVIEAGDFERNNPNVTNATAIGLGKNTRIDWQYDTVPQAFADNETSPIIWSAGKGVGGSTLINGKSLSQTTREDVNLKPQA
jgi:hypothetical protein